MSIAARLDRLRSGIPGHSSASANPAGPSVACPAETPRDAANALADALGGRAVDGVVQVTRDWQPADAAAHPSEALDRLPEVFGAGDADWIYIDTETTGLSGGVGTLAFMVGVARHRAQGGLQVRQFVLPGFSYERAMLEQLRDCIGSRAVIVSYNGKCFDLPLLQARLALQRIDSDLTAMRHLDLMYSVRRAFRRHWPDCRLQSAEKRLLGFFRQDDLPGAEAPVAWQAWLRQRDARALQRVIEHNFHDLVSLARLHSLLPAIYDGSYLPTDVDHGAVGRAWQKAGYERHACALWESGVERLDERDSLDLAAAYRRSGEWLRAEAVWLKLFEAGSQTAACELSKFYEHRLRDPLRAIEFADVCAEPERSRRLDRLQQKLGVSGQLSFWPPGSMAKAMK